MTTDIIKEARILKDNYYKMLGYPGISQAEKLIDDFCGNRRFSFGKHNGETISSVIIYDRQYIKWCIQNVPKFSLSDKEQAMFDCFKEGYKIKGDRMVITGDGVFTLPPKEDD